MAKFVESLIFSLTFLALCAAGLWFGGPMALHAVHDTIVAAAAEKQQAAATRADTASATERQTACAREASGGVRAGRQIDAIVSAPPRSLVTAGELQNVVGAP